MSRDLGLERLEAGEIVAELALPVSRIGLGPVAGLGDPRAQLANLCDVVGRRDGPGGRSLGRDLLAQRGLAGLERLDRRVLGQGEHETGDPLAERPRGPRPVSRRSSRGRRGARRRRSRAPGDPAASSRAPTSSGWTMNAAASESRRWPAVAPGGEPVGASTAGSRLTNDGVCSARVACTDPLLSARPTSGRPIVSGMTVRRRTAEAVAKSRPTVVTAYRERRPPVRRGGRRSVEHHARARPPSPGVDVCGIPWWSRKRGLAWVRRQAWIDEAPARIASSKSEPQRVASAAGMRVGGDHIGQARSEQVDGRLLDRQAVVAEQRADVDLEHGPGPSWPRRRSRPPSSSRLAGPLGVGDHEAVAAGAEAVADPDEVVADPAERRLEQEPAAARRARGRGSRARRRSGRRPTADGSRRRRGGGRRASACRSPSGASATRPGMLAISSGQDGLMCGVTVTSRTPSTARRRA